ncbi:MAG: hypothetical protein AAF467_01920 [Actinomycetota bacterium]
MNGRQTDPIDDVEEQLRATLDAVGRQIDVAAPHRAYASEVAVLPTRTRGRSVYLVGLAAAIVVAVGVGVAIGSFRSSTRIDTPADSGEVEPTVPPTSVLDEQRPTDADTDEAEAATYRYAGEPGVPADCWPWTTGPFAFGRIAPEDAPQCVRVPASQPLRFSNPLSDAVTIEFGDGSAEWTIPAEAFEADMPGTVGDRVPVVDGTGTITATAASGESWTFHVVPDADDSLAAHEMTISGYGPVELGMTVEEAAEALGTPFAIDDRRPAGSTCGAMAIPNLVDGPLFMIEYAPGSTDPGTAVVVRIDGGARTSTDTGIGVGTAEQEVLTTYGAQLTSELSKYGDLENDFRLIHQPLDETFADRRLVFLTDDGQVVALVVGYTEAALLVEGCL